MKVLFCTDGSRISYNSIRNLAKWADNLVVDIMCAADWSFLPDSVAVEDSDFAVKCTDSANSILNYTEIFLEEHGINIRQKIQMCGATVDSIMEACENEYYDMIVVGSNGKKGIQKWLGSVSQEVASTAKTSVYIAKELNNAKKILFTVDYGDISKNVIKFALNFMNLTEKEIYLTTVYEVPDYLFLEGNIDDNWIGDVGKKQEISALMLLNEFEKIFTEQGLTVKNKFVLKGNPANEIIKYTTRESIDLVVCGVRSRRYLSKLLLTSVSKRVLENTTSDVLIIRPDNFQQ